MTYVVMSLGTAVLYPVVSVAVYMLLARDTVTRWLWSKYPTRLDTFLSCTACSGTWYGLGLGILGWHEGWPFLGLRPDSVITVIAVAAWTKVLTPIIGGKHINALDYTSGTEEATPGSGGEN